MANTPHGNISEIKARLAAATPGPWKVFEHQDHSGLEAGPPYTQGYVKGCVNDVCRISALGRSGVTDKQRRDIEFIANAPADIAYLLAEVKRLKAKIKSLRQR